MANVITVTTAELRSKAGELRGQNQNLKGQVDNLMSEESALSRMWEGDANTAFHQAFTNDVTQMTAFYNAINIYCTALEEIAEKYDTTEAKNQSIASERTY